MAAAVTLATTVTGQHSAPPPRVPNVHQRYVTISGSLCVACLLALTACSSRAPEQAAPTPQYLYLWTASADSTQPDFLAVLDVSQTGGDSPGDSARYGALVTTLPVPGLENHPHHTEHQLAADRQLFANGFGSGQSFVFDLSDPGHPRIAARFGDRAGYTHPHSFLRMPNGHVLGTFQMRHEGGKMLPGGLVEMTTTGEVVRSSSADGPAARGSGSRRRPRSRPLSSSSAPPSASRLPLSTDTTKRSRPASRT